MRARTSVVLATVAFAAALAGCDRGATRNPNAPGSPGTGNPVTSVAPATGDTPPAGPHDAATGVVAGATGNGGGSGSPQPGQGLQGGMGAGPAPGSTPSGTPTSSAPTGASLPSGSPGTTYHSEGKN
jgi:hypothetical protein